MFCYSYEVDFTKAGNCIVFHIKEVIREWQATLVTCWAEKYIFLICRKILIHIWLMEILYSMRWEELEKTSTDENLEPVWGQWMPMATSVTDL